MHREGFSLTVKKYVFLCIMLFFTVFLGTGTGYVSGVHAFFSHTRTSAAEKGLAEKTFVTAGYIVKEHDGGVRVYKKSESGALTPFQDCADICVSSLPKEDRAALAAGIECKSLSDVLSLMEDFSG